MWQQKIFKSKFTKALLILLLLTDFAYTFKQNANLPLDGDIAPIIVPDPHYADVLKDPFGFKLLQEKNVYAAPNRYFSHAAMILYYKHVQSFLAPIFQDKIKLLYSMSGLFNTAIQYLLLFLITIYVLGHFKFWQNDFLGLALFIAAFFQTHGMYSSIGIIDNSITYTFFYALPLAILLLYFLPFYLSYFHQKSISNDLPPILWPIWLFLAIFLAFSGSIIAPLVLISLPLIVFWQTILTAEKPFRFQSLWKSFHKISKSFLFFGGLLAILCLYSFYIGQFNLESQTDVGIGLRYQYLLKGLPKFFFHKITFIVLGILMLVNYVMIQRNQSIKLNLITLKTLLFIGLICTIFILMLPLGGYREYRPWIIRYDTFMPITILLLGLIAAGTYRIIRQQIFEKKFQSYYLLLVLGVWLFFMLADQPQFHLNDCQNHALHQIEQSNEYIIALNDDCTILRWEIIKHPEHSKIVGEALHLWGITERPILFYQE
jgi:hypothetical protein